MMVINQLYKPDTFADIKGYCDLLDDMVKQIEKETTMEIKYFIVQNQTNY